MGCRCNQVEHQSSNMQWWPTSTTTKTLRIGEHTTGESTSDASKHRGQDATASGTQQTYGIIPKRVAKHHDSWLNAVMQNAIGETKPPLIPDFHAHILVLRPGPNLDIDVAPIKTYMTRYDLHIKVVAGKNQVELFHQAFCKWFLKLREANKQAIIYPWVEQVWDEEGILIENLTDIPMALPLLKKFMHKIFLCTTGGAYHVQVLLGTKQDQAMIMETICWWLKSTKQGMWRTDLQMAEDSMCNGWLLFLADKYDWEALSHKIWNLMGVHVALRYWAIDDGAKKKEKQRAIPSRIFILKLIRFTKQ